MHVTGPAHARELSRACTAETHTCYGFFADLEGSISSSGRVSSVAPSHFMPAPSFQSEGTSSFHRELASAVPPEAERELTLLEGDLHLRHLVGHQVQNALGVQLSPSRTARICDVRRNTFSGGSPSSAQCSIRSQ